MKSETLDGLLVATREGKAVVRAVNLTTGEERVLSADTPDSDSLAPAAKACLRSDRADTLEVGDERWFVQPFNPPLRLAIVGAVHIAQPLAKMAAITGFSVTIVDPREAFAHSARFPEVTVSDEWPDDALRELEIDARTAVVTLTHDPKLDDPALAVALESPAFYIGCLGSKRTHASRLGRLERKGFDATTLARIKGPVGLPIGAKSPAEIAVAILAQIVETLRRDTA